VRLSSVAGATLVLVFVAACGGGGPATTPVASSGGPAATCTGGPGLPVGIANLAFNPQSITVTTGGAVTWANADAATHTVTFDDGLDCGRLNQGGTVSRTFGTAGSFAYHCTIHPTTMKGTVVVQ